MRAPEDSANHSTGRRSPSARSRAAMMRRHSGSARCPRPRVGSPSDRDPRHPLGTVSVWLRDHARRRGSRCSCRTAGRPAPAAPSSSRSYSTNSPGGKSARRCRRRREHRDDLVRVGRADAPGPQHPLLVLGQRPDRLGRRRPLAHGDARARRCPRRRRTASRSSPSAVRDAGPAARTFSRPTPAASGAQLAGELAPQLAAARPTAAARRARSGCLRALPLGQRRRARRASPASACRPIRSSSGYRRPVRSSSRTGVRSRTSAMREQPLVLRVARARPRGTGRRPPATAAARARSSPAATARAARRSSGAGCGKQVLGEAAVRAGRNVKCWVRRCSAGGRRRLVTVTSSCCSVAAEVAAAQQLDQPAGHLVGVLPRRPAARWPGRPRPSRPRGRRAGARRRRRRRR